MFVCSELWAKPQITATGDVQIMWDAPTFNIYYQRIDHIANEILNKENPTYLLQVDFEDYLNFLVDKLKWEPLLYDLSQKTVEPFSVKEKRRDERYGRGTYEVELQRIRIRVPISPHPARDEYFKFTPSTRWGAEPKWEFEGDVLIHEVEQTKQAVQHGIEAITFWLGNRNKEIEAGNNTLKDKIRPVWGAKRAQLEQVQNTTQSLLQDLNIPIHQDPHAKVKPIEIKPRQLRTIIQQPKAPSKVETTLNRDEVASLADFIEQYARQFETAPKAYSKMDEEELRDLLVGMMNANYPGSATGETFSKLGKTDITLRLETGHILICECKFWSGAKAYQDAIRQLFNYLTWRQNYGVILNFSKLKNMTAAVSEAKRATTEESSFTPSTLSEQSQTRFTTRHAHPQDSGKSVEIFHLFIDLSI